MKKLSIFAVAAFACLCLIGVMSGEVFANGTETLGIPGTGAVAYEYCLWFRSRGCGCWFD